MPEAWRAAPHVRGRGRVRTADGGGGGEPAVALGRVGFPRRARDGDATEKCFYFEVLIEALPPDAAMAVGLTTHEAATYPGWSPGTFALNSAGELYWGATSSMGRTEHSFAPPLQARDTLGCGWRPVSGDIFFTLNGKLVGVAFRLAETAQVGDRLWPVVGLRSPRVAVEAKFEPPFAVSEEQLADMAAACEAAALLPAADGLLVAACGNAPPRDKWSLQRAHEEIDEFIQTNDLLQRATKAPRKMIMKALKKGKQKYFRAHGRRSPEPSGASRAPSEEASGSTGPGFLLDGAVDLASQMGSTLASIVVGGTTAEGDSAPPSPSMQQAENSEVELTLMQSELGQLEKRADMISNCVGTDPELAQELTEEIETTSKRYRQRLFELIFKAQYDRTLGDLLVLNDQLFGLIERMQTFSQSLPLAPNANKAGAGTPATADQGGLSSSSSSSSSTAAAAARGATTQEGKLAAADEPAPSLGQCKPTAVAAAIPPPHVQKQAAEEEDEATEAGTDEERDAANAPGPYGLLQSTEDSVRELLFFIRSGDEQAQMNAARTLSYLVREHQRHAEIRLLSQIEAQEGGGIRMLIAVLEGERAERNAKLKHAIATTIVAIVSGSWVNAGPSLARSASGQSAPGQVVYTDPSVVGSSFADDLDGIVAACKVLLTEPCYCCSASTWEDRPGSCAFTQREAALALANACLVLNTRDNLDKAAAPGEAEPQRKASRPEPNWAAELVARAASLLHAICRSPLPMRGGPSRREQRPEERREEDEELLEERQAWIESRQLATFAISVLAQYPATHQTMAETIDDAENGEHGLLGPVVGLLGQPDPELVLHAVTTLYWLCCGAAPPVVSDSPYFRDYAGSIGRHPAGTDLLAVGFFVARLAGSGAVRALLDLARQDDLPTGVRRVTIACLASLSALQPCRKELAGPDGTQALRNIAGQILSAVRAAHAESEADGPPSMLPDLGRRSNSGGGEAATEADCAAAVPGPFPTSASADKLSIDVRSQSASSTASSVRDTALNAGESSIRRRYSSSSQKNGDAVIAEPLTPPRRGLRELREARRAEPRPFRPQSVEERIELRHLALALHNYCIAKEADARGVGTQALCTEYLTELCYVDDDSFVLMRALSAIFSFSQLSDFACDALEKARVSRAILHVLRAVQTGTTAATSLRELSEIKIDGYIALGNFANASMETRLSVFNSGALEHAIGVLQALHGLSDAQQPDVPSDSLALPSGMVISVNQPQGNDIEVVHQAVRVLAGLVEMVTEVTSSSSSSAAAAAASAATASSAPGAATSTVGLRRQEQRARGTLRGSSPPPEISFHTLQVITSAFSKHVEDMLLITVLLMVSPASVIQYEACRVLASITRCPLASSFKFDVARLAMKHLVKLAIGSVETPDRQLQLAAEDVLVGLGYKGGVADVQLCCNDPVALFQWHVMMLSLEDQQLMEAVFFTASCAAWRLPLRNSGLQDMFLGVADRVDLAQSISLRSASFSGLSSDQIRRQGSAASETAADRLPGADDGNSGAARPSGPLRGFPRRHTRSFSSDTTVLRRLRHHSGPRQPRTKRGPVIQPWLKRLVGCGAREPAARDEDACEAFKSFGEHPELKEEGAAAAAGVEAESQAIDPRAEVASYVSKLVDTTLKLEDPASAPAALRSGTFKLREPCEAAELRAGTRGLLGALLPLCGAAYHAHFPSLLQRRRFLLPAGYFEPARYRHDLVTFLPRMPLAIALRYDRDLFFRFGAIVHQLISRYSMRQGQPAAKASRDGAGSASGSHGMESAEVPYTWSLSVRGCASAAPSAAFCTTLTECLFLFPVISSLSFLADAGDEEESLPQEPPGGGPSSEIAFSQVLNSLPSTVAWLTLDGVLSDEQLKGVAHCIERRRDHLGLQGLALRNLQCGQRAWKDVVGMLAPAGCFDAAKGRFQVLSSSLASPPHALRSLDLSSNALGDQVCGLVLRAVALSRSRSTVESLDLSRNAVGERAEALLAALLEPGKGLLYAEGGNLVELRLSRNGLGNRAASTLLSHLGKVPTGLRMFDIAGNEAFDEATEEALAVCVEEAQGLLELDVSANRLSAACGRRLAEACAVSSLHFLVLEANEAIALDDVLEIEAALSAHRSAWAASAVEVASVPSSEPAQHTAAEQTLVPTGPATTAATTEATEAAIGTRPKDRLSRPATPPVAPTQHDGFDGSSSGSGGAVAPSVHTLPPTAAPSVERATSTISAASEDRAAAAAVDGELERPRLSMMFSVPLAGRDANMQLSPVEAIDHEREREILWEAFRKASRDIDVSFGFATTDHLRSEVTMQCRAIHYSGHGTEGGLLFEHSECHGGVQVMSPDKLRWLSGCEGAENKVELVVVSACHSELAGRAFVEAGIAHVVCVRVGERILDKAAQTFTRQFYLSLAMGNTVRNAFDAGKRALDVVPANKYLLLPLDADHNVSVFPGRSRVPYWPPPNASQLGMLSESARQKARMKLWRGGNVPGTPPDFVGRRVAMYQALAALREQRILAIWGGKGMGKTALAAAVSNYAAERTLFRDGILFLRLEKVSKVTDLLDELSHRTVDSVGTWAADDDSSGGSGGGSGGSRDQDRPGPKAHGGELSEQRMYERRSEQLFDLLRCRQAVLVLDHCGMVVKDSEFQHFVGRLLDEAAGVRLVLTCSKPLRQVAMYPVASLECKPLSARDAAILFVRTRPHSRELSNLFKPPKPLPGCRPFGMLDALGEHRLLFQLRGCPGALRQRACSLKPADYTALLQECRVQVETYHRLAAGQAAAPAPSRSAAAAAAATAAKSK